VSCRDIRASASDIGYPVRLPPRSGCRRDMFPCLSLRDTPVGIAVNVLGGRRIPELME
jgi:hypothetical protein